MSAILQRWLEGVGGTPTVIRFRLEADDGTVYTYERNVPDFHPWGSEAGGIHSNALEWKDPSQGVTITAVAVNAGGESPPSNSMYLPETDGLALLILAVVCWERRPWRRR